MTIELTVTLTAFFVKDKYFFALYKWLKHFTNNLRTGYCRRTNGYISSIVEEHNAIELDRVALCHILKVLHENSLSRFYLKLLSLNLYDSVHSAAFC